VTVVIELRQKSIILAGVGNDLNQTINKSPFKLLQVTYDFDLNQSTECYLWWFKSIIKWFWFFINIVNRLECLLGCYLLSFPACVAWLTVVLSWHCGLLWL